MGAGLYRPGQWNDHVTPDLKEPFPWAHPNYPNSFHPFSRPTGTLAFGAALTLFGLLAGGTALTAWAQTGDSGAFWAGLFALAVFVGIGLWGVTLGVTRLRWQRRFTQQMGFSPFERRP
jgi:hypothetical protein